MAKFRRRQRDALGPDLSSLDTTLKQAAFAEVYVQVRSSFQGARQIFSFHTLREGVRLLTEASSATALPPKLPKRRK